MKAALAVHTATAPSREKAADSSPERRRRRSEALEYRVYCAFGCCLFLPLVVAKRVLGAFSVRKDRRSILTETYEEVQNILGIVFTA